MIWPHPTNNHLVLFEWALELLELNTRCGFLGTLEASLKPPHLARLY